LLTHSASSAMTTPSNKCIVDHLLQSGQQDTGILIRFEKKKVYRSGSFLRCPGHAGNPPVSPAFRDQGGGGGSP
jgi:hypothetical protein